MFICMARFSIILMNFICNLILFGPILFIQIRATLETLLGALTPIDHAKVQTNEVQPALMNADLLSRESESISLLLSLLVSLL